MIKKLTLFMFAFLFYFNVYASEKKISINIIKNPINIEQKDSALTKLIIDELKIKINNTPYLTTTSSKEKGIFEIIYSSPNVYIKNENNYILSISWVLVLNNVQKYYISTNNELCLPNQIRDCVSKIHLQIISDMSNFMEKVVEANDVSETKDNSGCEKYASKYSCDFLFNKAKFDVSYWENVYAKNKKDDKIRGSVVGLKACKEYAQKYAESIGEEWSDRSYICIFKDEKHRYLDY